jgi:hypothetical protein
MKSTGEILAELGFKKDAPQSSQEAFLKHLLQAAGYKVSEAQDKIKTIESKLGEQLSFNLDPDQKVG